MFVILGRQCTRTEFPKNITLVQKTKHNLYLILETDCPYQTDISTFIHLAPSNINMIASKQLCEIVKLKDNPQLIVARNCRGGIWRSEFSTCKLALEPLDHRICKLNVISKEV